MPGIHLCSSNNLEALADIFADKVSSEPLAPFEKETILIQSRGMARWLAMETASRLNIWANCHCPFPNTFINNIYQMLLDDLPGSSFYDRESLVWHLMSILPEVRKNPHFRVVDSYLESDNDLKLYQLSSELADLFDQYTLYRPQMILAWENDTVSTHAADEHEWQAILWRRLAEKLFMHSGIKGDHRAALLKKFEQRILDPSFDAKRLPSRISVFGITSLPPYHLKVLSVLANHIDLYFYIMNPCMEYWFDIIADRDIVKISRKEKMAQETLHLSHGNQLLSSMGHLGRDFLLMLHDQNTIDFESFKDPGRDTLLANIQQDILFLRDSKSQFPGMAPEKKPINPADNSICFHSCHSAMREVEILYDQLLDIFDNHGRDNLISPREVLVMAPDIDTYAPLIRAVFDAENSPEKKIPYSISDQTIRKQSSFIEAFFYILSFSNSRFTSVDVLEILENEAVRNRFSMNDNDLEKIKTWVDTTNICWGIDKHHKTILQLPDYEENSWRAGLDRLLLGYAMPGYDRSLFHNILPYDNIEGNETNLLGSFLDFAEGLFELPGILREHHTLKEWSEILLYVRNQFFLADAESEFEDRLLLQAVQELEDIEIQTSFAQPVSINVIRSFLLHTVEHKFSTVAGEAGFLAGGVTFCSMLPMRAIPFKVICLLGMNDGQYPRSGRKRSFDLISLSPRRGDRSRRHDDRYLFLETILSARNRLIISFAGQSIQDGSSKPPSVLVNELKDYISQGFYLENGRGDADSVIIDHLTAKHRLQPFHPDYFSYRTENFNDKIFSYSPDNCAAAAALLSSQHKQGPIITSPLPEPADEFKCVDHRELAGFLSHPAKYFLVKRLGIWPVEESRVLNTSEPFQVKGLERYRLENDILEQLLAGEDCTELFSIKKAAGELPHGKLAEIDFNRMVSEVRSFKVVLDNLLGACKNMPMEADLTIGEFTITGQLDCLYDNRLVLWRYASIKPRDILCGWIVHLVINSLQKNNPSNSQTETFIAGKNEIIKLTPPADSIGYLEEILGLYWQGLSTPLHFFPPTSHIYASEIHKGKDSRHAMLKARTEWEGNNFNKTGDKNDPYNLLCFKNMKLPETDFADTALKIFRPILEHQSKYN